MPTEIGVSSRTESASASHHEKHASTMGPDLFIADLLLLLAGRVGD
jgi:hypothetical protein